MDNWDRNQIAEGEALNILKSLAICSHTVKHNVRVCLYIAYIACGSASLYIKTLYFFLAVLALSAAATVANIKIRYDVKTPQFAIFWTRVICVFYSISEKFEPQVLCSGEERHRKQSAIQETTQLLM